MKISDLNQRVQGFYQNYHEQDDGDFEINLESAGWFWAKITPLSFQQNTSNDQAAPCQNRYEVVMQKTDISTTRHAYLRKLRWNHKLLEIYTPWLEISEAACIKGLAKESIEG